ncbi:putative high affinity sulfate transporter (SulP) [Oceaniovalibus guishaninsula JLT2003]|uniref:Putative high affinity sulfate transporter (SulP) n=1 Tax=Oceaniovalibus guishaninsula JLT2003 TaxID=1231392 RepID=K2GKF2_9RHOB|nr:SulP family inorganic anion transporter [Oceaniovalibus guishaninsula]EKE43221.1 putative high affinity sulfate transporter (SulP) [Oceaniovalibus guishaninsula JLT2003]
MGQANEILGRLSPIRPWFRDRTAASLKADALAGLTNATIVLPQGVAFAIIAGLPPEYGLFTAIVVTVVAALWGSSRVMVSGPTTAISAVLFASLSGLALPGSETYIALALALTFLVGILQLAAGLAGLGGLITFISHSVIVGFTAAAAVLIAVSQLGPALGLAGGTGGVLHRLGGIGAQIGGVNGNAVAVAVVTLASLIVSARISRRLPGYIIALVAGSLAAVALGGEATGVATFAPLDAVLPAFGVPDLQPATVGALLPAAVAVACVGLLEAISIGKSFAIRRGEPYDSNQEMVGQGLSNLTGSFFQCYAGSGSFTRSGLNAESGATSPLSAIFAAGFLAVLLVLLAPFVRFVPMPAMAAIILYVAWKLINLTEIRHIVATSRSETLILGATFLTGILSELDFAILVGVVASLSVFLNKSAHPLVAVGAPTEMNGRRVFMNARTFDLPQCPQIRFVRIEGPLFFASVEHVEREFRRMEQEDGFKTCILNLKGVGKIDLAGADFILSEARRARTRGNDLHLIVANPGVLKVLDRLHCLDVLGAQNVHPHKSGAIRAAVARASDPICAGCDIRCFTECSAKPGA